MSENTQNQNPKQEQYSLNDDRRVKVLSPGALVAKRFFRNRLAVLGMIMLLVMFVFSFFILYFCNTHVNIVFNNCNPLKTFPNYLHRLNFSKLTLAFIMCRKLYY